MITTQTAGSARQRAQWASQTARKAGIPASIASILLVMWMLIGCGRDGVPAPSPQGEAVRVVKGSGEVEVDHHRVQFRYAKGAFEFVGSTPVASRMPVWRGRQPVGWTATAFDDKGVALHTDHLRDPRRLRGEFKGDGHIDGHHFELDEVECLVRVPPGTRRVVFRDAGGRLGESDVPEGGAP